MHWLMDQQKTDAEAARSQWDSKAWRHSGAARTLILPLPKSHYQCFPLGGAPDNTAMLITAAQDSLGHANSASYIITPLATGLSEARHQPSATSQQQQLQE